MAISETTVPLVEERLEPRKKEIVEEATIVKEPIRETKQMDVNLTNEELALERKPLSEPPMNPTHCELHRYSYSFTEDPQFLIIYPENSH